MGAGGAEGKNTQQCVSWREARHAAFVPNCNEWMGLHLRIFILNLKWTFLMFHK